MEPPNHLLQCKVLTDLSKCDRTIVVTYLALTHGYAWAIPEALLCFQFLVVIVSARAQGCAKFVLVLCKPLQMPLTVMS